MDEESIKYLIDRLYQVIDLIEDGHRHMAIAKLLADISALKCIVQTDKEHD